MCRKSKALSVFNWAERAQRRLHPLLVVPANVGVHHLDELLHGDSLTVPGIEQLGLQPFEEALAGRVVR